MTTIISVCFLIIFISVIPFTTESYQNKKNVSTLVTTSHTNITKTNIKKPVALPAADRKFKIIKVITKLKGLKKFKKKGKKFLKKKLPKFLSSVKKFKPKKKKKKPFKKSKKCIPIKIIKQIQDDSSEEDYDFDLDDDSDRHIIRNQHYNYYYQIPDPYQYHQIETIPYYHTRRNGGSKRKRRAPERRFFFMPNLIKNLIKASTYPLKAYGVHPYQLEKDKQGFLHHKEKPSRIIPVHEIVMDIPPSQHSGTFGVMKNDPTIISANRPENKVISYNKFYFEPPAINVSVPTFIPPPIRNKENLENRTVISEKIDQPNNLDVMRTILLKSSGEVN